MVKWGLYSTKKSKKIKFHHRREYIAALSKKKVKCESSHESYSEIDNKEEVSLKDVT